MNIGKLQHLVSEDNSFCWVYNDFCSDLLLYDIIDFLRMKKSIVESCLDKKKFCDILSSFKMCWSFLWRLLVTLWRSLLRIDEASLLETFRSLKIRNFGYTPSCLQSLRKQMPDFSLFSYLQKSLTVSFSYSLLNRYRHLYILLAVQNLKIFGKKQLYFLNNEFQSYYNLFQINWLVIIL